MGNIIFNIRRFTTEEFSFFETSIRFLHCKKQICFHWLLQWTINTIISLSISVPHCGRVFRNWALCVPRGRQELRRRQVPPDTTNTLPIRSILIIFRRATIRTKTCSYITLSWLFFLNIFFTDDVNIFHMRAISLQLFIVIARHSISTTDRNYSL